MGFFTILTLIFVVLKVLGIGVVATWSWLVVFSPLVVEFVLALIMFGFFYSQAGKEYSRGKRW